MAYNSHPQIIICIRRSQRALILIYKTMALVAMFFIFNHYFLNEFKNVFLKNILFSIGLKKECCCWGSYLLNQFILK